MSKPIYPVDIHLIRSPENLSKREYFAAMAMQGLLGAGALTNLSYTHSVSQLAVMHADALIENLGKGEVESES